MGMMIFLLRSLVFPGSGPIFSDRGSLAAVIRVVRFELPDAGQLNLPDVIMGIAKLTRGMVLVTGPAGSGKKHYTCMYH